MLCRGPPEERWVGEFEFEIERERGPLAHQTSGFDEPFGRQEVEATEDVVIAPKSP
jgi:hypothetical protein